MSYFNEYEYQKWFSGISLHVTNFDELFQNIIHSDKYLRFLHRFYEPKENESIEISNYFNSIVDNPVNALTDFGSCIVNGALDSMSFDGNYIETPIESGQTLPLLFNNWLNLCLGQEEVIRINNYNIKMRIKGHGVFKFLVIPSEIVCKHDWSESDERNEKMYSNLFLDDYYEYDSYFSSAFARAKDELISQSKGSDVFVINN
jgi:hypothetical protein